MRPSLYFKKNGSDNHIMSPPMVEVVSWWYFYTRKNPHGINIGLVRSGCHEPYTDSWTVQSLLHCAPKVTHLCSSNLKQRKVVLLWYCDILTHVYSDKAKSMTGAHDCFHNSIAHLAQKHAINSSTGFTGTVMGTLFIFEATHFLPWSTADTNRTAVAWCDVSFTL